LSDSTAESYLAAAKVFLEQLHEENPDKFPDIYSHVRLFKQDRGHKKDGLFPDELNKLLKYIIGLEYSVEKFRLTAIFFLKYFHGFRDHELYNLNVGNLDLTSKSRETASIFGKGRDQRENVRLHPFVVKALKNYLVVRKQRMDKIEGIDSGALFVSFSRNSSLGKRLSKRTLGKIMADALLETGIAGEKDVRGRYKKCSHGLIHACVNKTLKVTGGDVSLTQELVRKELQTIKKYKDKMDIEKQLPKVWEGFNTI
jgi:site-specific recombinase XerD